MDFISGRGGGDGKQDGRAGGDGGGGADGGEELAVGWVGGWVGGVRGGCGGWGEGDCQVRVSLCVFLYPTPPGILKSLYAYIPNTGNTGNIGNICVSLCTPPPQVY
jgi:hypothetical protein